ncbi:hypothetical protein SAMN05443639_116161 [Stigmatella erecta]|uniref:Uncharacterized protein n=1 Tax=Stigmatella erecta TaxID=83460 RepID=A0A1I0KZQ7_9BACT|nr:hypothetical protein SAMN05443639_116161 [Stigmatella erecta]
MEDRSRSVRPGRDVLPGLRGRCGGRRSEGNEIWPRHIAGEQHEVWAASGRPAETHHLLKRGPASPEPTSLGSPLQPADRLEQRIRCLFQRGLDLRRPCASAVPIRHQGERPSLLQLLPVPCQGPLQGRRQVLRKGPVHHEDGLARRLACRGLHAPQQFSQPGSQGGRACHLRDLATREEPHNARELRRRHAARHRDTGAGGGQRPWGSRIWSPGAPLRRGSGAGLRRTAHGPHEEEAGPASAQATKNPGSLHCQGILSLKDSLNTVHSEVEGRRSSRTGT